MRKILQERWRECKIADGYWLSRSAGSGKICIASEADPQPKEVNIVELLRKLRVNVDELSRKLEVNVDELIPKLGEGWSSRSLSFYLPTGCQEIVRSLAEVF